MSTVILRGGVMLGRGIRHHWRSDAFCLAAELLEPLRPMVDKRVTELHR